MILVSGKINLIWIKYFFSRFHCSIFLSFLVAHCFFIIVINFSSANDKISCLWAQVLENYYFISVMVYFLNISHSLKFCIASFAFELADNLNFLLVVFIWGILFDGVVWGFLCFCIGTMAPLFLLSLVAGLLNFKVFSGS